MYYNSNMKKIVLIVIALVGSISAFAGDKDIHQTIYQTVYQKNVTQQPSLPKTNQPFYIQQSYSRDYYYKTCMAGHEQPITSVETMARNIANQLVCSELNPIKEPVGVSVIVDLNKLHQTTDFGRLLSEDLISELQRKNMAVIDIRAQTFMLINDKGEFYLSRNTNNLRKEYKIGYVLVGTYSVGDYSTSVNARIVDVSNGLVVATAHASIPTGIISDLLYNSSQSVPELQLRDNDMSAPLYAAPPPPPPPTTPPSNPSKK